MKARRLKVIITMIGLDGHTTGAEVISRILRDAGVEVIYLGVNQTPEMIASAAIQEDVDLVGISAHASNYGLMEDLVRILRERGVDDVPVIVGGNVPKHKAKELRERGIAEVFPPGVSGATVIDYVLANARGGNERAA
mgnify:CR=1 FL=1